MLQQISDLESKRMKTTWENGGTAFYADEYEDLKKHWKGGDKRK